MTPETYVIGSIAVAVILVRILNSSDPVDNFLKCPRCGAEMQFAGGGGWYERIINHVVPEALRLLCPQCGYSKRAWA